MTNTSFSPHSTLICQCWHDPPSLGEKVRLREVSQGHSWKLWSWDPPVPWPAGSGGAYYSASVFSRALPSTVPQLILLTLQTRATHTSSPRRALRVSSAQWRPCGSKGMHLREVREVLTAIESSSTGPGGTRVFPCFSACTTSWGTKPQTLLPLLFICSRFSGVPGLPFISCFLGLAHTRVSPAGGLCPFHLPESVVWWVIAVRQAQVHVIFAALAVWLRVGF